MIECTSHHEINTEAEIYLQSCTYKFDSIALEISRNFTTPKGPEHHFPNFSIDLEDASNCEQSRS